MARRQQRPLQALHQARPAAECDAPRSAVPQAMRTPSQRETRCSRRQISWRKQVATLREIDIPTQGLPIVPIGPLDIMALVINKILLIYIINRQFIVTCT